MTHWSEESLLTGPILALLAEGNIYFCSQHLAFWSLEEGMQLCCFEVVEENWIHFDNLKSLMPLAVSILVWVMMYFHSVAAAQKRIKISKSNKAVLEPRISPVFMITYFYNHCSIRFDPIPQLEPRSLTSR